MESARSSSSAAAAAAALSASGLLLLLVLLLLGDAVPHAGATNRVPADAVGGSGTNLLLAAVEILSATSAGAALSASGLVLGDGDERVAGGASLALAVAAGANGLRGVREVTPTTDASCAKELANRCSRRGEDGGISRVPVGRGSCALGVSEDGPKVLPTVVGSRWGVVWWPKSPKDEARATGGWMPFGMTVCAPSPWCWLCGNKRRSTVPSALPKGDAERPRGPDSGSATLSGRSGARPLEAWMFGKTDGATPHGKSAGVIPLATKLLPVRGVVFLDRELAGAGIGPSRNAAPTCTAKHPAPRKKSTCLVQALWRQHLRPCMRRLLRAFRMRGQVAEERNAAAALPTPGQKQGVDLCRPAHLDGHVARVGQSETHVISIMSPQDG